MNQAIEEALRQRDEKRARKLLDPWVPRDYRRKQTRKHAAVFGRDERRAKALTRAKEAVKTCERVRIVEPMDVSKAFHRFRLGRSERQRFITWLRENLPAVFADSLEGPRPEGLAPRLVRLGGIASTAAAGTPSIAQRVTPAGIPAAAVGGTPAIVKGLPPENGH